ncbi:MAG: hypothetical protein K2H20_01205, partial [Bacilli bacterium]|nr:hypothetical protein [Bacilli bacterium]
MHHKKLYLIIIILFVVLFTTILTFLNLFSIQNKKIIQEEIILNDTFSLESYKKEYSNEEIVARLE